MPSLATTVRRDGSGTTVEPEAGAVDAAEERAGPVAGGPIVAGATEPAAGEPVGVGDPQPDSARARTRTSPAGCDLKRAAAPGPPGAG